MAREANEKTKQERSGTGQVETLGVIVNGERLETCARSLAELIAEAGYGDARIATAINGQFVPARARTTAALTDGDRIEIVAPRQGG